MAPKKQPRLVNCKLCDVTGALHGEACPDCDGDGFIEEGSDTHAMQLKIARNKVRKSPHVRTGATP
jgi:DnaJ-class molecular chaperone